MTRMFPLSPLFNADGRSVHLLTSCLRLLLLVSLVSLTACTKDKDFNTSKVSADFTEQNFEAAALGLVQAAMLTPAHTPLFDVLSDQDLSDQDLPMNCEAIPGVDFSDEHFQHQCRCDGYEAPDETDTRYFCDQENTACFSFHRATAGNPVGNRVRAKYNHCDQGSGEAYNGTAKFTDTKFEGLARELKPNNTQECISSIITELTQQRAGEGKSLEQVNTYTVSGLELIFVPAGPDILVRVGRMVPNGQGDLERIVEDVLTIERDETAILVLEDSGTTDQQNLTTEGDMVYTVIDRESKLELCQSMYRTLSAELTDFGMIRDGAELPEAEHFSAFMKGTVTLQVRTEDFENFSGRIADNSAYSIRVDQGSLSETYAFEDMLVIKGYSREHDNFSYQVSGYIDFAGVGKAMTGTLVNFIGHQHEPYFRSGQMAASAYDVDAVRITVQDSHMLKVEVAPEGSEAGTIVPTYTLFVDTPWSSLIARDFLYADD